MNPYQYKSNLRDYTFVLQGSNAIWRHYSLSFSSGFETKYLGNKEICAEYYFPIGTVKAPVSILVHGMGDSSIIPCRMIARTLAKKGIASLIIYLVFHARRITSEVKKRYPRLSPEEWFESYQMSVTDVHQILDWVQSRPEIDQSRISIVGISFGSFVASIAMALDKRIKSGVLIESGGNSDKITRFSALLRWQYRQSEQEFQKNQKQYLSYLDSVNQWGFENTEATKISYLTDTLTFANTLRGRPVMMINALWDEIIPKRATHDLWDSLGNPPISWFPATHASIWIWFPLIGPKIAKFLTEQAG